MSNPSGKLFYRSVSGGVFSRETSFDQSAPYCVNCNSNLSVSQERTAVFCVIEAPDNYDYGEDGSKAVLAKNVHVNLSDCYIDLNCGSVTDVGTFGVSIFVGTPSDELSLSKEYLYTSVVKVVASSPFVRINIPDMSAIPVASGNNIVVSCYSSLPGGRKWYIYHVLW